MVEGKDAILVDIQEKNPLQVPKLLKDADDLQKDADVVLEAVTRNGLALEWASEELKKDQDVVLAAVKNNGWAIEYVDLKGLSEQPKDIVKIIIHAYKNVEDQEKDGIEGSLAAFMDFLKRVVAINGEKIINKYKQLNNIEKDNLLNEAMGKNGGGSKKRKSSRKRKGSKKRKGAKKRKGTRKRKGSKKRKGSTTRRR